MRIIIDGPSNKEITKLSKNIAEKYDLSYCHMLSTDYMNYNFLSQTLLKKEVVWDTHFIRELVNCIIHEKDIELSSNDMKNLINMCNNLDIKIVIMLPTNITDDEKTWYNYFGNLFDNPLFFKQGTNLSILYDYLERRN